MSSNVGINDTPFVDTWHSKPWERRAATTLQCWKRRIWLSCWFPQQAEQHQRCLRLRSLCCGASAYTVSVRGNHQPPPTLTDKTSPTQRSSVIPSRIVVCRYHEGGRHNSTIILVVARVEGIGPVLPILEGGRCVCHFVFGLHRLWWQQQVFLLGLGGQILHPTSHPTPLPHVSNWPTGITSVGSHGTTIPPLLCYSLAFPSAYCAVVALLIVLSNWHTNSTSTG